MVSARSMTGRIVMLAAVLALATPAFSQGVAVGDVVAIPNTGGYLMHILESASHQIPLARNVSRTTGQSPFTLDPIDA